MLDEASRLIGASMRKPRSNPGKAIAAIGNGRARGLATRQDDDFDSAPRLRLFPGVEPV